MLSRLAVWMSLALVAGLAVAPAARAGEAGPVNGVSLTVYNDNLALIREQREFDLSQGEQTLLLSDVAGQLEPDTVHLELPDGLKLRLLEQNFDNDLISQDKLLSKFIGGQITLVDDARQTQLIGTLLSVSNGLLLKTDGKLLLNPPGRVVLPASSAQGLLLRPTLSWLVDSPAAGKHQAEISYLSGGLSWQADYVLMLNADDTAGDLAGWVTLNNTSGATYTNADLKIVAGQVHRVPPPAPPEPADGVPKPIIVPEVAGKDGGFHEQSLFEYHLYELGRQTTIKDNQQKQIELLKAAGVPLKKAYLYNASEEGGVDVTVEFKNEEAHGLGIPLPAGDIRVFTLDNTGEPVFLNQDSIEHTPRQEKVTVKLGTAFDIEGTTTEVERKEYSDGYSETYKVTLANRKRSDAALVTVEHSVEDEDWTITNSSLPYVKKDTGTFQFQVLVKADSERELTYTYRVKQ